MKPKKPRPRKPRERPDLRRLAAPPPADFYRLPDMTVTLTGEDELEVAALVTDEYGRQVVLCNDPPYILDEEDQTLTWPGTFETDPDPAHWQFD